jgi:tRNA(adenine34) deaminase
VCGAIVLSRVDRRRHWRMGRQSRDVGSVGDLVRHPRLNHRPEVQGGVLEAESAAMLREFFSARR